METIEIYRHTTMAYGDYIIHETMTYDPGERTTTEGGGPPIAGEVCVGPFAPLNVLGDSPYA